MPRRSTRLSSAASSMALTTSAQRRASDSALSVGNAGVEPKGNAIVDTTQALGTAKIDPLLAAFNAVGWMSAKPASSQPSIFVI